MRLTPSTAWILLVLGWESLAQEGDAEIGARLAHHACADCHLVANNQTDDPAVGPTFFDIARETTVDSLRAYLQTPHASEPHLTSDQVNDVCSYILGLRQ